MIRGGTQAEPLLKAVYAKVLQAGGHPLMQVSLPGMEELLYSYASDEQLQYIHAPQKLILEASPQRPPAPSALRILVLIWSLGISCE